MVLVLDTAVLDTVLEHIPTLDTVLEALDTVLAAGAAMAAMAAMAAGATVDTDAVANPEYHIVTLKHHDKLIYFFYFFNLSEFSIC
jgi:hypothetical protein